ncbi:MAG: hypothetical protein KDC35_16240 [Acidobacteria bacterium]|nr:hypothetical protein [Acidobacteriota bacterium]
MVQQRVFKTLGLLWLSTFVFSVDRTQNDPKASFVAAKTLLESGYSVQDLRAIDRARLFFEARLKVAGFEKQAHYYAALADYRAINAMNIADQRDEKEHLARLDRAIDHLEWVSKRDNSSVEPMILLYTLYSRRIGLKPLSAMSLFGKMEKARDTARRLSPANPRLLLVQAIYDYHAPKRFGGDREKAHVGFLNAVRAFVKESPSGDSLTPDWGYEDACSWLGISYRDRGDSLAARQSFERAVQANPHFAWARDVLLPTVLPNGMSSSTSSAR